MPNAIIETLKGDTENGEKYYIYPVTLESAVVDNNGTSLATKLENINSLANRAITSATVPVSAWTANENIYTATITGLSLDTNANYEIAFNHSVLSNEAYLSLASCFIVPSAYTNTTLTLKALSAQPTDEFSILILKR